MIYIQYSLRTCVDRKLDDEIHQFGQNKFTENFNLFILEICGYYSLLRASIRASIELKHVILNQICNNLKMDLLFVSFKKRTRLVDSEKVYLKTFI